MGISIPFSHAYAIPNASYLFIPSRLASGRWLSSLCTGVQPHRTSQPDSILYSGRFFIVEA
eukprot:4471865-Pleurochrysis_carterae.AAC.1